MEGDKFMKGIMVAAGATLDGGVWEPHFVPSSVKMNTTGSWLITIGAVMQRTGLPQLTLFTLGYPANSPDLKSARLPRLMLTRLQREPLILSQETHERSNTSLCFLRLLLHTNTQTHTHTTDTHTQQTHTTKHSLTTSHAGIFPGGVVSFMTHSAPFEKSK